jgi:hypothetical protein
MRNWPSLLLWSQLAQNPLSFPIMPTSIGIAGVSGYGGGELLFFFSQSSIEAILNDAIFVQRAFASANFTPGCISRSTSG